MKRRSWSMQETSLKLLDDERLRELISMNGFFNYSRELLDAYGLLANKS